MGLIICPDCKAKVSDQAMACIKCGRPIALKVARKEPTTVPSYSVGPCPRCGSCDTYDHVAQMQRQNGGGWAESLGAKWGAIARLAIEGKGRYFCNKCRHNWNVD